MRSVAGRRLGLSALAGTGFVALSVRVALVPGPSRVDRWLQAGLVDHLSHRQLLFLTRTVTYGLPVAAVLVLAVAAGAALRLHDRAALVVLAAGPALSVALGEWVVKPLVGRPEGDGVGFPSGHGLAVAATAVAVVIVAGRPAAAPRASLVGVAAAAATVLSLAALVVLRYHYVTDVLGSALLALTVVPAVAAVAVRASARPPH